MNLRSSLLASAAINSSTILFLFNFYFIILICCKYQLGCLKFLFYFFFSKSESKFIRNKWILQYLIRLTQYEAWGEEVDKMRGLPL